MTIADARVFETRTAEQRAQDVVNRIVQQAEPIPAQNGGGHRLDSQLLYSEILAAVRETIDDLAYCTGGRPS